MKKGLLLIYGILIVIFLPIVFANCCCTNQGPIGALPYEECTDPFGTYKGVFVNSCSECQDILINPSKINTASLIAITVIIVFIMVILWFFFNEHKFKNQQKVQIKSQEYHTQHHLPIKTYDANQPKPILEPIEYPTIPHHQKVHHALKNMAAKKKEAQKKKKSAIEKLRQLKKK